MNWQNVAVDLEKRQPTLGLAGRWVMTNTIAAILLTLGAGILFGLGTFPSAVAVLMAIVVPPMVEASVLKQDLPLFTTWNWVWRSLLGLLLGVVVAIVLGVGLAIATGVARSTGSAEPDEGLRLAATLFGATTGAIARAYIQWPTLKVYFPASSPHIWCAASIASAVLLALGNRLSLMLPPEMGWIALLPVLMVCSFLAYVATGLALAHFTKQADQVAPAPAEATLRF